MIQNFVNALQGKKTYLLVWLAAGIQAFEMVESGGITPDSAENIVYTFMAGTFKAAFDRAMAK